MFLQMKKTYLVITSVSQISSFEQISSYDLNKQCSNCGCQLTAPKTLSDA